MARIRSIKPDFFTDEKLAECCRDARLLFMGLIVHADDEGRMAYSAKRVTMQVFPGDQVDVAPWIAELAAQGIVRLYQIDGHNYLCIPNFLKHQKINKPTKSRIPGPDVPHGTPENSRELPEESCSATTPNQNISLGTGSGTGSGTGRELEREIEKPTPKPDEDFDQEFDGAHWFQQIMREHPKKEFGNEAQVAVMEAIEWLLTQKLCFSKKDAADHLFARTRLYKQATRGWPDQTMIPGAAKWYRAKAFEQDEAVWIKGDGQVSNGVQTGGARFNKAEQRRDMNLSVNERAKQRVRDRLV